MRPIQKKLQINKSLIAFLCVLILLFGASALLWSGKANSNQAMSAMVAKIYFDGEYRILDGSWQKIVSGQHIPSTKGDVTLRGNFHMLAPDGEYVGIYTDSIPIALYTDHINLTFYEGGNEPYISDVENPLYGDSACHEDWTAYVLTSGSEEPIEILIHNPHSFGNETAIDELLSNVALWSDIEFEKFHYGGDIKDVVFRLSSNHALGMKGFYANGGYKVIVTRFDRGYMAALEDAAATQNNATVCDFLNETERRE